MTFLCAIEAVNLDNLFGDCQDLSTTRGGGLSVLDIGKEVADKLHSKPITSGSSKGLFDIKGTSAEEVEERVRKAAASGILRHATVMVAACLKEEGAFVRQVAELNARIRWSQMQAPSVIYPQLHGELVCDIDRVRPGVPRPNLEEKKNQSDFSYGRRTLGREKKARLLQDILPERDGDFDVVEHLQELSDDGKRFGNLGQKLAVLRFDGNDFGKVGTACDTEARYQLFADTTKNQQREFFRALLAPPEWWTEGATKKPRIEIVVYGGDEVTLITPAWLGWKALAVFYKEAKKWQLDKYVPLTYSAGVVFCHYKAPIHAVKQLASELADQAKDRAKKELGAKGNFAAYQVLESFDSVGEDLEGFLNRRYQHTGARGAFLGLDAIEMLESNMEYWHGTLSRRKLHSAVRDIMGGKAKDEDMAATIQSLVESTGADSARATATLNELYGIVGSAALLHILELWDYAGVTV